MTRQIYLIFISCFISPVDADGDIESSGSVALEYRSYLSDSDYSEHQYIGSGSFVFEPEFEWISDNSNYQCRIVGRTRSTSENDDRKNTEIKESYCRYDNLELDILVGINTLLWGVVESNNIIDIVNQRNVKEGFDSDEKLGAPMIAFGTSGYLGAIKYYYLPLHREADYPDDRHRWVEYPEAFTIEDSVYEDGYSNAADAHIIRYSGNNNEWDYAYYLYRGLSRDALLIPGSAPGTLKPFYYFMRQQGVDVQFTTDWLIIKIEAVNQKHDLESFYASVFGLEKKINSVLGTNAEVTFIYEYLYDNRTALSPVTAFDDDHFVGIRLALNNESDTTSTAGIIYDASTSEKLIKVEWQSRIGNRFTIKFDSRYVWGGSDGVFQHLHDDGYVELGMIYYY